jgi:hypothetical protein
MDPADAIPDPGDTRKFLDRYWYPFKPAIHILAAVAVIIDEVNRAEGWSPHIGHLLLSPEFIRRIVAYAECFEEAVLTHPKIAVPSEELIRLRLAS